MSESLRPEQRIRRRHSFQTIFDKGRFFRGVLLNLWVYEGLENEEKRTGGKPKLGIIVSRKTDLKAVRRNLWKRRIREVFRRQQKDFKLPVAILIQSKKQPKMPSYQAIEQEMKKLFEKAQILK